MHVGELQYLLHKKLKTNKTPEVKTEAAEDSNDTNMDIFKNKMNQLEDKVFSASYGVDPILVYFSNTLNRPENNVRIILVSMNTCIRNAIDNEKSFMENVRVVTHEVQTIINVVSQAFNSNPLSINSYLCFYITNHWDAFPEDRIRPVTPGRAMYHQVCMRAWNNFDQNHNTTKGNMLLEFHKLQKTRSYASQLQSIIRGLSTKILGINNKTEYLLLSHNPLDFHLLRTERRGKLISSHTAEIIPPDGLGEKVFGDKIPFYNVTHMILGDKVQIKPSVSVKVRQNIRKHAYMENWHIKTEQQITKSIRSLGVVIT